MKLSLTPWPVCRRTKGCKGALIEKERYRAATAVRCWQHRTAIFVCSHRHRTAVPLLETAITAFLSLAMEKLGKSFDTPDRVLLRCAVELIEHGQYSKHGSLKRRNAQNRHQAHFQSIPDGEMTPFPLYKKNLCQYTSLQYVLGDISEKVAVSCPQLKPLICQKRAYR